MDRKKIKQISEAYERIQAIENDIRIIQSTAERALDKNTTAWISLDFEDDLLRQMEPTTWQTTSSSGTLIVSEQPTSEEEFTVSVPDTVTLEILGVILRHKQQLIEDESNNI
jgi:hypothetical protein